MLGGARDLGEIPEELEQAGGLEALQRLNHRRRGCGGGSHGSSVRTCGKRAGRCRGARCTTQAGSWQAGGAGGRQVSEALQPRERGHSTAATHRIARHNSESSCLATIAIAGKYVFLSAQLCARQ